MLKRKLKIVPVIRCESECGHKEAFLYKTCQDSNPMSCEIQRFIKHQYFLNFYKKIKPAARAGFVRSDHLSDPVWPVLEQIL
jgi:hypothetical protein